MHCVFAVRDDIEEERLPGLNVHENVSALSLEPMSCQDLDLTKGMHFLRKSKLPGKEAV